MLRIRKTLISPISSFFIFILFFIFPIIAFIYVFISRILTPGTIQDVLKHDLFTLTFTLFIVFIFLSIIVIIIVYSRKLVLSLIVFIQQSIQTLIIGTFFGYFTVLVYLIFRVLQSASDFESVMATAIGIYLSAFGLFVSIYSLAYEKIPILDLGILLEKLAQDIELCQNSIFYSYPGLSLGSISVGGERYERYHKALFNSISNIALEKTFILFTKKEIVSLYKAYIDRAKGEENDEIRKKELKAIGCAIKNSVKLIEHAQHFSAACFNHKSNSLCKVYFVRPEFRPYVIIIDDIVYFLIPQGLPIKSEKGEGKYISAVKKGEKITVDFVAIRLQNGAIAGMVKKLTLREQKEFNVELV